MALLCINSASVAHISVLAGFAVIFVVSVALPTAIPEVTLLLALIVYCQASQTHHYVQDCRSHYQRLVASVAAFPLLKLLTLLLLGVSLAAAALNAIPEAGFAIAGIVAYYVLHFVGKHHKTTRKSAQFKGKVVQPPPAAMKRPTTHRQATVAAVASTDQRKRQVVEERQPDTLAVRVQAQVTQPEVTGRDAEVQEIVHSNLPTAADDLVVRKIITHVRKSIVSVVPEAVVVGSAAGNIVHLGAQDFKPEVDIMVMASPEILTERLRAFFLRGQTNGQKAPKSMATLNPDMLQKTATRVLSERLSCLRFWRSQFTGPEPKVVLLAPVELGFCPYPIRINFSVNNPYPQRLSLVLEKSNARSKELILLVTHWANTRGISNAGKGHLRSYAYSLLVVYFLRDLSGRNVSEKSTVELFIEFAHFYRDWFDRSLSNVVDIRFFVGEELPPSAESKLFGIPFIEDPFATTHNVASTMTADGVTRLKEELARALCILEANPTTLGKLLERWSPQASGEE